MFTHRSFLVMAAIFCLVCFMAFPALAQEGYQGEEKETAPEISDANLEKVADAYTDIIQINENFQQSLQKTEDPTERQEMQVAANNKMVRAIRAAGLDVEQYNSYMREIRNNQGLGEEFMQKIQSRR